MSEKFLYEQYPPQPSILWFIANNNSSPKNFEESEKQKTYKYLIKKAFRVYVEIISLYDLHDVLNFSKESFTVSDWINTFREVVDDNKEGKEKSLLNFDVKLWLSLFGIDNVKKWLTSFEIYCNIKLNKSQKKEILSLVPFDNLKEISDQEIRKNREKIFTNELKKKSDRETILNAISPAHELRKKINNRIKNINEQSENKLKQLRAEFNKKKPDVKSNDQVKKLEKKFKENKDTVRKDKEKQLKQIFKDCNLDEQQEILKNLKFEDLKKIVEPILRKNKERTFGNDFTYLVKNGFLHQPEKRTKSNKIDNHSIQNKLSQFWSYSSKSEELEDVILDETINTTLDTLKSKKRFFIQFQHIIRKNNTDAMGNIIDKVGNIVNELKQIWEQENQLIWIKYKSSSRKKEDGYIIYPITLFYNQRGIYLAGYGYNPDNKYKCEYYNYRLDHLCQHQESKYLVPITWEDDYDQYIIKRKDETDPNNKLPDIHPDLIDNKREIQQWREIEISAQLSEALGVDLHRKIKTMLLRFPEPFHEYYIKNTNRHETFKQLKLDSPEQFIQQLKKRFQKHQTEIKNSDFNLIEKIIKAHPDSAYYTMNYRHGEEGGHNVEADVIMRLRAWCPNVEVLLPWDLRKRMREDMKKTWQLYQDDSES